jgi:hypothetical protein
VSVQVRGVHRKLQCRRRRRSFTRLYDALDGHYGLVVRDDGRAALVVLPLETFAALCGGDELADAIFERGVLQDEYPDRAG